ncbi:S-layer homology domain-containing protein [Psychrobacillus sp. FSL H8-0484]|uniref:S-layer homology domain-containing protein n=1 Tax=Psychrobacillus sp. FSL H8-0484 TaxID=2921390 RepID=UPI0030FC4614
MKTNKLFLATLASAVAIPAMVAPMQTEAFVYNPFKDVSAQNVYYDIIHKMRDQEIISGYEDGTFHPSETISRKHAAVLITRAVKNLPTTNTFKQPKDLSTSNAYYGDIKKLMEAGLLELDSKGNINPNAPLTRGDMAKILATAYELDTKGSHGLKDVSGKYSPYVAALATAKITTGFEDGTFRENESLTRAHYAVFMFRSMNLTEEGVVNDIDLFTLYENSYIGKYGFNKVPLPNQYKGKTLREVLDIQTAEYDKHKAMIPRGGYGAKVGIETAERFKNNIKNFEEITGTSPQKMSEYIDESAKTGKTVYFVGENGKKYFFIFGYNGNIALMGENHLK